MCIINIISIMYFQNLFFYTIYKNLYFNFMCKCLLLLFTLCISFFIVMIETRIRFYKYV